MRYTLDTFYRCDDWRKFRDIVIANRLTDDGLTICEYCGKPILKTYDIILHHSNVYLTEDNVNDVEISLNPDNIQLVHHSCHNKIHNKLGYIKKEIYLVYGSPFSGKTSYIDEVKNDGDLIVDIDSIWECVSGCDRYIKPDSLKGIVFGVRDYLIDSIRVRRGSWNNAYIIGGYPLISERERMCKTLGCRLIYIDSTKEECLERLKLSDDSRNKENWEKYINDWWDKYAPHSQII